MNETLAISRIESLNIGIPLPGVILLLVIIAIILLVWLKFGKFGQGID